MTKINKYANGIERFLHGEKGQRFFNFAYSIGAAIVIWGALFKILHLPGGSLLLCIGMGTEIAMFILTAFDRPPKEYAWEEVFPVLDSKNPEDRPDFAAGTGVNVSGTAYAQESYDAASDGLEGVVVPPVVQQPPVAQQQVSAAPQTVVVAPAAVAVEAPAASVVAGAVEIPAMPELPDTAAIGDAAQLYAAQMKEIADRMTELNEIYASQMQDLNRNVGGLNTIYEIQLKSISAQLSTIDRVNNGLKDIRDMYEKSAAESAAYCEETEKMARYMRQLNAVYEKMVTAMTINMNNPMMGGAQQQSSPFNTQD